MIGDVMRSSVILIVTLWAARIFRHQSAARRHLIWTAGLIAVVIVPLWSIFLPVWQPDIARSTAELVDFTLETPISTPVAIIDVAAPDSAGVITVGQLFRVIWLAGAAAGMLWLVLAIARLEWMTLRAKSRPDDRWATLALDVSRALKLNRPIRLLQFTHSSMLGTWGVLRPRLVVPRIAETWPDECARVVLAHELSHIRRHDWLVQVIAESARAICWFNPLFWVLCNRLRLESEHACDDAVLGLGVDGPAYAAHLLDVARTFQGLNRPWSPVLAMAQHPDLERRFLAMLNPSLNRKAITPGVVFVVFLLATGLTVPIAAMRAPFQESSLVTVNQSPAGGSAVIPNAPSRPAVVVAANTAVPVPMELPPQGSPGKLTGVVYDATGARIPGVKVILGNAQGQTTTKITVLDGSFEMSGLQPGQYALEASLPGFAILKDAITIQSGRSLDRDLTLSLGRMVQRYVVEDEAGLLAQSQRLAAISSRVGQRGGPPGGGRRGGAQPSTSSTPEQIRIGGNVIGGNVAHSSIIELIPPVYPRELRGLGIDAVIQIEGILGVDGILRPVEARSTTPVDSRFVNAALDAVRQWRYRPTLLNGMPFEVPTTITVEFKRQ